MAELQIEVGQEVPVLLQIEDGATDQYPQAEIRDNGGNLITTLSLSHEANGCYTPLSPYTMPDEDFIKITYIVYSDSGHTTESDIYLRGIDVFHKIDSDDYKADVSALALEATAQDILADTDELQTNQGNWLTATGFATQNPPSQNLDDYKADVSGLAIEANVEGHVTDALNAYNPPTRAEATDDKNEILTEVGGNTTKLDAIQADLDNPDQYKADVSNLDVAVSTRSSHSVADIWSYATRTLTSFGSLVADIWAHVSRTLTAGTRDSEIDAIKAKTDNLKDAWNDPSVSEIDAELTSAHGGGSWMGGGDGTFYYVDGVITIDMIEDDLTVDIIEDELMVDIKETPVDDLTVDIIEDGVISEINEENISTNICEEKSC